MYIGGGEDKPYLGMGERTQGTPVMFVSVHFIALELIQVLDRGLDLTLVTNAQYSPVAGPRSDWWEDNSSDLHNIRFVDGRSMADCSCRDAQYHSP